MTLPTSACTAILAYVRAYHAQHGDTPSLGEIATAVRRTKPHVARALAKLERTGELVRLPAPPRRKRRIILPEEKVQAASLLRALGWKLVAP